MLTGLREPPEIGYIVILTNAVSRTDETARDVPARNRTNLHFWRSCASLTAAFPYPVLRQRQQ